MQCPGDSARNCCLTQRWISPRDVLDLWEELERDVENLGIDQIGASIQHCKLMESEVCPSHLNA